MDAIKTVSIVDEVEPAHTITTIIDMYKTKTGETRSREPRRLLLRPTFYGLLSAVGMLAFYLGVITFAQDWQHALQQLGEDRWFVGAIAVGFGLQVALFTLLRTLHANAAAGGIVASTGTSTGAMLACCAHHMADILPVLGLSSAAAFLDAYKTPLLWLAMLMNLAGVVYLLGQIRKQRASQAGTQHGAVACHTVGQT